MTAPKEVKELVERFERNIEAYTSGKYNETQLRREFIDPLFEALGWDVNNKQGYAEPYKDVIHEDSIKVAGGTKAPDYCFRIGGSRKFFVEAKKPSVNIKNEPSAAFQVRRYAWSSKLPLSILTDFEELAIYDCLVKPSKTDNASVARVNYYTYKDYLEKWDEIASVFSKDAVQKGSFDKYAESGKKKRGTTEVDDVFLKEIEGWREAIAKNIAVNNSKLSQEELNFAVQKMIDRIIFLRICEDRHIEDYGRLMALQNGTQVYERLSHLFREADDKYNSGLFHFQEEKERPEHFDGLSLKLKLDDDVLKEILKGLYYPESPYEFSVLPADILGHVYEQFLGKVIRLTVGHRAVIEEKPEVRKAGGIYYTPTYIVDYIVQNTVGKLLEGKTPEKVSKLRILDPACGSGSFLIQAYQHLVDWHRDYYVNNDPKKYATKKISALFQDSRGEWRLTTSEKKRILLNNIYGVDIDNQAVEVTKLSLLLKVLEGETEQTINSNLRLFHERALPDLGDNIKCGNSLIESDFSNNKQISILSQDEVSRVNAFDWDKEFSAIINGGGFDAIIGNPPYGAFLGNNESNYLNKKYSVFGGVKDVYPCFIEMGFAKLRKGGELSYIVPSAWLGGPDYKQLRISFLSNQIQQLILLPFDIFADAYVDTTIFVASKQNALNTHTLQTYIYGKKEKINKIDISKDNFNFIKQSTWKDKEDNKFVLDPRAISIIDNIRDRNKTVFNDVINIKRGVLFDKDLLTKSRTSANSYRYFEGDVYRYNINLSSNGWIEFNEKLKERPKELIWFKGARILLRRLVNRRQRLMASILEETFITNKNLYSILIKQPAQDIRAVLGILNSRLISYLYIKQVTQATKDDFPQVTIKDLLSLPFPGKIGKQSEDQLLSLVNNIMRFYGELPEAKVPNRKEAIQRQIESADNQIDQLVYKLYGLTQEEIEVVERDK